MKTFRFSASAILVALVMVFASCSKDETDTPLCPAENGASKELSTFEKADLLSLLEIQKMHRDVYSWMNAQFPSQVFSNLAASDGKLMEMLSIRVDKYGLVNPVVDKVNGEFEDATIQDRYDEFVRTTSGNLEAMINQAKAMEEAMIAQVEATQSTLSGNTDIGLAYDELIRESISQLNVLNDEMKGLIHIHAPKNDIKDM